MEERKLKREGGLLIIFVFIAAFISGCANYTIPGNESGKIEANSCEGCHTDYERLIDVHDPDTTPPPSGCGGTAPEYQPYDRVFLGGSGYEEFKSSAHYGIGCTNCHGGVGDTGDKYKAHSDDWNPAPSIYYEEKCGMCHEGITETFASSLHNGIGQKRKVTMRSGLGGAGDFDQLPAHQIAGYNDKCAQCHGTCGNCHVVRPIPGGGGLSKGHKFTKTPDMINGCVVCHSSRGGHAYLGVAPGTTPDLHLEKAGYDCLNCHDGHELHGTGEPVQQRYAYTELPQCEQCHSNLEKSNSYHTTHFDDFNCQVCHSQDYNNCGACHIKDGHAEYPAYLDFKIAMNPIKDVKDQYEIALVRRTLAHPDNWTGYDEEYAYTHFDVFPTYNYTTPHNILRWTERTSQTGSCSQNCHIRKEADSLINKELYLFKSDLLDWEISATGSITMDDQLPSNWFN
jgi:thiosulfate/3-mercaptopyruvate sulfurtransferase